MNLAGLVLNLNRIMDILSLAKITIDNCINEAYRAKNSLSKCHKLWCYGVSHIVTSQKDSTHNDASHKATLFITISEQG